ncbi:hypothetical protein O3P69_015694 [Scylla paramamosain]|uniref:HECT domain-containing protein n=1 Tax=Scylla paramamosain TaxID=85552 RepID=A0AAW0SHX1_SCYPA
MPCAGILIDFIYAWGDNGYGQLGVNSCDTHTATPKLVKSLARKVTVQLACGANHTLALTADGELHRQGPQKDPALVTSLAGTPLVLLAAAGHHSAAVTQAGYLLLWGSNKQGQLGYTPKGDPLVRSSLGGTSAWPPSAGRVGVLRTFAALPYPDQMPLSLTIQEHMIKKLLSIEEEDMIDDDLFTFVLAFKTWPRVFLRIPPARTPYARDRRALVSSLWLLSLVHGLNFQAGCRVGWLNYDDFYIPEIAEKIDIRNDYLNWMNSRLHPMSRRESPILFCEYPFLFDPQAKTLLLRCDATRQMQGEIQEAVLNSNPMLWLFDPAQVQFLNVHIRRTHIVEGPISQLLHHEVTDYKRPLKVHFIGEEAEDAGGVRKEFFLLLLRDILNPDYGMFTEFPDTRRIWFKEGALEAAATYVLIGEALGVSGGV